MINDQQIFIVWHGETSRYKHCDQMINDQQIFIVWHGETSR
jgi:hypothetical protein